MSTDVVAVGDEIGDLRVIAGPYVNPFTRRKKWWVQCLRCKDVFQAENWWIQKGRVCSGCYKTTRHIGDVIGEMRINDVYSVGKTVQHYRWNCTCLRCNNDTVISMRVFNNLKKGDRGYGDCGCSKEAIIYCVRATDNGYSRLKVGKTGEINEKKRYKEGQVFCPLKHDKLYAVKGSLAHEFKLHRMFDRFAHVRGVKPETIEDDENEWFLDRREIHIAFINAMEVGWDAVINGNLIYEPLTDFAGIPEF